MDSPPDTPRPRGAHPHAVQKPGSRRPFRTFGRSGWVGVLAVLGAASCVVARLAPLAFSERLPLWDEAKYATSGLRLADAVATFDPLAWFRHVHELSTWPPVWPLVEAAALLAMSPFTEPSFATVRVLTLGLFALAALLTAWLAARWTLGRAEEPARDEGSTAAVHWAAPLVAFLAASLAAAWWLGGPLFQVHAVIGMLEVPSVVATAIALGARLRAESAVSSREAAWRGAWWAACALFLCKYNYGLLFLLAAGCDEALRAAGGWRALGTAAARSVKRIQWRRPWTWVVATACGSVVAIRASGGFEGTIAGVPVRATSAGPAATALLLLALVRAATWRRAATRAQLAAWRAARPRWRSARWPAFALTVWLAIPPHLKEMLAFVENRSSHLTLGEGLTFYPRALAEMYAPNPWLGWLVLGLAAITTARWLGAQSERRTAALLLSLHAVALVVHPYKLPRFALVAAWLAGLVASVAVGRTLGSIAQFGWVGWSRESEGDDIGIGLTLARGTLVGLAGAVLVWVALEPLAPGVATEHAIRTVDPRPAVEALVDQAEIEPVVVLGTWNELSPGLLEFRLRARRPRVPADRLATASDWGHRLSRLRRSLEPQGEVSERAVWWIDDGPPDSPRAERQATELAPLLPLRDHLEVTRGPAVVRRLGHSGSPEDTRLWRYAPWSPVDESSSDGSSSDGSR